MSSNFIAGRKHKILLIVLSFVVSAFFIFLYIRYSFHVSLNSDVVQGVVEVTSILHGNILLHGWTLSPDNFVLSDLPLYLFIGSFLKNQVLLSHLVPIIIYLLIIFTCILLALRKTLHKVISLFSVFIIIGMLPLFTLTSFLQGFVHIGSILEGLLSLYFLIKYIDDKKRKYLLISCLFLFLALFSDPFIIWIFSIPYFIFLILKIRDTLYSAETRSVYVLSLVFILITFAVAELLRYSIPMIGGYTISSLVYQFATFSEILSHVQTLILNLLYIFGANFMGQGLFSHQAWEAILHLGVLFLVLFFSYVSLKKYKSSTDGINYILSIGIGIDILAFIFSNFAVSNTSSARYLFPVIIFGSIVVARSIGNIKHLKGYIYVILFSVFFIFLAIFYHDSSLSQKNLLNESNIKVADFLLNHHLNYGYGYYWNSSIITVETNSSIKVRAVVPSLNNKILVPYLWISSRTWYGTHYANFIVYDKNSSDFRIFAVDSIGKPAQIYHFGEDTILIWNKNITPYI